jgi:DNA-binding response OmpR family regulator
MLIDLAKQLHTPRIEIAIVDPQAEQYLAWAHSTTRRIALATTAEAALRLIGCHPTIWVIHAELPDLTGIDLYRQLSARRRLASAILVSDEYHASLELSALALGSLCYRAKPLDLNQLERLCGQVNQPAEQSAWQLPELGTPVGSTLH